MCPCSTAKRSERSNVKKARHLLRGGFFPQRPSSAALARERENSVAPSRARGFFLEWYKFHTPRRGRAAASRRSAAFAARSGRWSSQRPAKSRAPSRSTSGCRLRGAKSQMKHIIEFSSSYLSLSLSLSLSFAGRLPARSFPLPNRARCRIYLDELSMSSDQCPHDEWCAMFRVLSLSCEGLWLHRALRTRAIHSTAAASNDATQDRLVAKIAAVAAERRRGVVTPGPRRPLCTARCSNRCQSPPHLSQLLRRPKLLSQLPWVSNSTKDIGRYGCKISYRSRKGFSGGALNVGIPSTTTTFKALLERVLVYRRILTRN